MRSGEKWIIITIGVVVVALMGRNIYTIATSTEEDPGIPFYSTASPELERAGSALYDELKCKRCHSLWTIRDPMQSVPAPALDGMGSLRDEQWLYEYFSAEDPQSILKSRLKEEYRMRSYAHLPEQDRRTLAAYIASLKVEDWYLEELKKTEYEKLTGEPYPVKVTKQELSESE